MGSIQMVSKREALAAISCILISLAVIRCKSAGNHRRVDQTDPPTSMKGDSLMALLQMFGGANPRTASSGEKLVEGDMIVTKGGPNRVGGSDDLKLLWPHAEVPYQFHDSVQDDERQIIEAAMKHWSTNTCIRFRPRKDGDAAFTQFRTDTPACWSKVGRQTTNGSDGQDINLSRSCATNINSIVHEIGHTLGFYHEQSRSDRDESIRVLQDNVSEGMGLQFEKRKAVNSSAPYDIKSTMHYVQWAFSKDVFDKNTIVALNPAHQRFLATNHPLSFRDRKSANSVYACSRGCSGSCFNGGYMRRTGYSDDCSCDCPPNYSGLKCGDKIRDDYYDELPCGGTIEHEGRIQTPEYPKRARPGMSCMWDIHAPTGKVVQLKFDDFSFAPRFSQRGTRVINKCFNETVEIRLRKADIFDGQIYCGNDIKPDTVMKSEGQRATVIITANDKMIGRGLSAEVKFILQN